MDRGLFPLYYLHLEREYGKKIFLLAGESNILSSTDKVSGQNNRCNHIQCVYVFQQAESVRRVKHQIILLAAIQQIYLDKLMDL